MIISDWIEETQGLLVKLGQIDLGYPLGNNVIQHPARSSSLELIMANLPSNARQQLAEFYGGCDGIDWPDVHKGLFIECAYRLLTSRERGEPDELVVRGSSKTAKILVLGTDGGGGKFCVDQLTGKIIHIVGGRLTANRLEAEADQVSSVAEDFSDFLGRLQADLRALIIDDREHHYLP